MAPKLKSAPKIAAVALAAVALGTVVVPSASAAPGPGYFGVKTVYSETPSIFGFRGYFGGHSGADTPAPGDEATPGDGTDPGNGGDPGAGTDPGTDPGTGGGGWTPPFPQECTVSYEVISDYFTQTGTMDGTDYLSPRQFDTTADNPYGYSPWIDEALAQGATISVGQPSATLPSVQVDTYDPATGDYEAPKTYRDVNFDEFNPYTGSAKAVPAGTISDSNFPSFYKAERRAAAKFGAIQISDIGKDKITDAIYTESFLKKVNAAFDAGTPGGSKQYSVNANLLLVKYPLKVDWPADSKYSKCSVSGEADYSYSFGAA